MAETFLAVQRGAGGFEQRVCVKFILPAYRENPDFRRLFLREASIGASLRHSNIVSVIDVDDAASYLVLELVDGVDLRALLNAAPGRRLAPELAILVTIELCKALAYAHGRKRRGQPDGIVHRDLSPSNVLVSYAGEIKLTDFGVARAMRADVEPLSTTIKGKLCYMSPEQARGQLLDGRSDLFSLGIVCYELLSGQRPFDGQTDAETLLRVTAGDHTPLLDVAPDVPPALAQVVERLLCRDREQRFISADACIDAFARFSPPATCFRALGELARAARPHETLAFEKDEDLPELDAPALRVPGMLTATQGLPMPTSPRTSPVPPIELEVPSQTSVASVLQRVPRNAWAALGLSVALLLAVGSAWLTRLAAEPSVVSLGPQIITTVPTPRVDPEPASQQTAAASGEPPPITPPAPQDPPELHAPRVPAERAAQKPQRPQRVEPQPQPQQAETEAPKAVAIADAAAGNKDRAVTPATLTVGIVPMGQVWIDDRPLGWSPITLPLKPGRYNIAGGRTQPGKQHVVKLKPGETKQVVIDLDGDESSADDTTSSPTSR